MGAPWGTPGAARGASGALWGVRCEFGRFWGGVQSSQAPRLRIKSSLLEHITESTGSSRSDPVLGPLLRTPMSARAGGKDDGSLDKLPQMRYSWLACIVTCTLACCLITCCLHVGLCIPLIVARCLLYTCYMCTLTCFFRTAWEFCHRGSPIKGQQASFHSMLAWPAI